MNHFRFEETLIEGLKIVYPFVAEDERGYYMKFFEHNIFEQNGIFLSSHEEAQSFSYKGVIRGLHFQTVHPQSKLVRVISGAAYDVAVDLREGSPTFGKWYGTTLSSKNQKMFYIPEGFAHGLMALTNEMILSYMSGDDYSPESDGGIRWDDPELGIQWPLEMVERVIVSKKDQNLPLFREFCLSTGIV